MADTMLQPRQPNIWMARLRVTHVDLETARTAIINAADNGGAA
jgi:hypothetical protein